MVAMIIKGLFKRYERWNPVHPTYGAFWGMGVGIGCGVGWGPGFGPEVIGYVGAGCGVGFSIGITLAGVGIGLPANFFTDVPYKGYELSNNISSQFSTLQQKANESFSYLKDLDLMKKGTDVFDVKSALCSQGKLISENFRILKKNLSISSKVLATSGCYRIVILYLTYREQRLILVSSGQRYDEQILHIQNISAFGMKASQPQMLKNDEARL